MFLPTSLFIAWIIRFFRDANENDWFFVLDELDACDHALEVNADQEVNGLARIPYCIREIRVQVDVAEQQRLPPVGGDKRRIAFGLTQTLSAWYKLSGLRLWHEFRQPARRERLSNRERERDKRKQSSKPVEVSRTKECRCYRVDRIGSLLAVTRSRTLCRASRLAPLSRPFLQREKSVI